MNKLSTMYNFRISVTKQKHGLPRKIKFYSRNMYQALIMTKIWTVRWTNFKAYMAKLQKL